MSRRARGRSRGRGGRAPWQPPLGRGRGRAGALTPRHDPAQFITTSYSHFDDAEPTDPEPVPPAPPPSSASPSPPGPVPPPPPPSPASPFAPTTQPPPEQRRARSRLKPWGGGPQPAAEPVPPAAEPLPVAVPFPLQRRGRPEAQPVAPAAEPVPLQGRRRLRPCASESPPRTDLPSLPDPTREDVKQWCERASVDDLKRWLEENREMILAFQRAAADPPTTVDGLQQSSRIASKSLDSQESRALRQRLKQAPLNFVSFCVLQKLPPNNPAAGSTEEPAHPAGSTEEPEQTEDSSSSDLDLVENRHSRQPAKDDGREFNCSSDDGSDPLNQRKKPDRNLEKEQPRRAKSKQLRRKNKKAGQEGPLKMIDSRAFPLLEPRCQSSRRIEAMILFRWRLGLWFALTNDQIPKFRKVTCFTFWALIVGLERGRKRDRRLSAELLLHKLKQQRKAMVEHYFKEERPDWLVQQLKELEVEELDEGNWTRGFKELMEKRARDCLPEKEQIAEDSLPLPSSQRLPDFNQLADAAVVEHFPNVEVSRNPAPVRVSGPDYECQVTRKLKLTVGGLLDYRPNEQGILDFEEEAESRLLSSGSVLQSLDCWKGFEGSGSLVGAISRLPQRLLYFRLNPDKEEDKKEDKEGDKEGDKEEDEEQEDKEEEDKEEDKEEEDDVRPTTREMPWTAQCLDTGVVVLGAIREVSVSKFHYTLVRSGQEALVVKCTRKDPDMGDFPLFYAAGRVAFDGEPCLGTCLSHRTKAFATFHRSCVKFWMPPGDVSQNYAAVGCATPMEDAFGLMTPQKERALSSGLGITCGTWRPHPQVLWLGGRALHLLDHREPQLHLVTHAPNSLLHPSPFAAVSQCPWDDDLVAATTNEGRRLMLYDVRRMGEPLFTQSLDHFRIVSGVHHQRREHLYHSGFRHISWYFQAGTGTNAGTIKMMAPWIGGCESHVISFRKGVTRKEINILTHRKMEIHSKEASGFVMGAAFSRHRDCRDGVLMLNLTSSAQLEGVYVEAVGNPMPPLSQLQELAEAQEAQRRRESIPRHVKSFMRRVGEAMATGAAGCEESRNSPTEAAGPNESTTSAAEAAADEAEGPNESTASAAEAAADEAEGPNESTASTAEAAADEAEGPNGSTATECFTPVSTPLLEPLTESQPVEFPAAPPAGATDAPMDVQEAPTATQQEASEVLLPVEVEPSPVGETEAPMDVQEAMQRKGSKMHPPAEPQRCATPVDPKPASRKCTSILRAYKPWFQKPPRPGRLKCVYSKRQILDRAKRSKVGKKMKFTKKRRQKCGKEIFKRFVTPAPTPVPAPELPPSEPPPLPPPASPPSEEDEHAVAAEGAGAPMQDAAEEDVRVPNQTDSATGAEAVVAGEPAGEPLPKKCDKGTETVGLEGVPEAFVVQLAATFFGSQPYLVAKVLEMFDLAQPSAVAEEKSDPAQTRFVAGTRLRKREAMKALFARSENYWRKFYRFLQDVEMTPAAKRAWTAKEVRRVHLARRCVEHNRHVEIAARQERLKRKEDAALLKVAIGEQVEEAWHARVGIGMRRTLKDKRAMEGRSDRFLIDSEAAFLGRAKHFKIEEPLKKTLTEEDRGLFQGREPQHVTPELTRDLEQGRRWLKNSTKAKELADLKKRIDEMMTLSTDFLQLKDQLLEAVKGFLPKKATKTYKQGPVLTRQHILLFECLRKGQAKRVLLTPALVRFHGSMPGGKEEHAVLLALNLHDKTKLDQVPPVERLKHVLDFLCCGPFPSGWRLKAPVPALLPQAATVQNVVLAVQQEIEALNKAQRHKNFYKRHALTMTGQSIMAGMAAAVRALLRALSRVNLIQCASPAPGCVHGEFYAAVADWAESYMPLQKDSRPEAVLQFEKGPKAFLRTKDPGSQHWHDLGVFDWVENLERLYVVFDDVFSRLQEVQQQGGDHDFLRGPKLPNEERMRNSWALRSAILLMQAFEQLDLYLQMRVPEADSGTWVVDPEQLPAVRTDFPKADLWNHSYTEHEDVLPAPQRKVKGLREVTMPSSPSKDTDARGRLAKIVRDLANDRALELPKLKKLVSQRDLIKKPLTQAEKMDLVKEVFELHKPETTAPKSPFNPRFKEILGPLEEQARDHWTLFLLRDKGVLRQILRAYVVAALEGSPLYDELKELRDSAGEGEAALKLRERLRGQLVAAFGMSSIMHKCLEVQMEAGLSVRTLEAWLLSREFERDPQHGPDGAMLMRMQDSIREEILIQEHIHARFVNAPKLRMLPPTGEDTPARIEELTEEVMEKYERLPPEADHIRRAHDRALEYKGRMT